MRADRAPEGRMQARAMAATPSAAAQGHFVLMLDVSFKDKKVLVVPEDEDRFLVSVDAAVKACQAADKTLQFGRQFRDILLPRLGLWISDRADKLKKAYLTVREEGLLFVAILARAEYDRELEDDLSELDIAVARDPHLDLIDLEVLALPNASDAAHASFLNPEATLEYRAQRT